MPAKKETVALDGRERLLAAARRVIAKAGITGATMRAIAEEAGLSTGAIYHYYASKEDVLYDVMSASLSESRRISEASRRGSPKREDILDEIGLNIRRRFDKHDENRIQFYLAQEAMLGDKELRSKFRDKYGEWIGRIEELLGFLYGGAGGRHRRALACLLLGAIDGAALQLLVGANQASADEMARVYRVLLVECLPAILKRVESLDKEGGAWGPGQEARKPGLGPRR
jgi:AcrR family transcriptional regulator